MKWRVMEGYKWRESGSGGWEGIQSRAGKV